MTEANAAGAQIVDVTLLEAVVFAPMFQPHPIAAGVCYLASFEQAVSRPTGKDRRVL